MPYWILYAELFLHDFEYQQRYEADEEVRLDALRVAYIYRAHVEVRLFYPEAFLYFPTP